MESKTERRGMDVRSAAAYCGVSERTVWALIAAGELRVARIGRKVVVLKDQLDALLERATRERVATNA